MSSVPCTAPFVSPLIVITATALIIQFVVFRKPDTRAYRRFVIAQVLLFTCIAGTGSYRISPFYSETNPLRGFNVTVGDRPQVMITSGEIITLGQNSTAVIVPLTLPNNSISCKWSSQNHGALDDPASCETIYAPPAEDYDILRLHMQSDCGLPDAVGQIKLSILP